MDSRDNATAEESAFAIPRITTHSDNPGVALPQPLTPSDAALVRRIFDLQAHGKIAAAREATAELDSKLLLGTILANRYLGRYHHSTAAELGDWLALYGDQPEAPAIHALLLHRLPKGAAAPPTPPVVRLESTPPADAAPLELDPQEPDLPRRPAVDRAVQDRAQRGNPGAALRLIANTRGVGASYAAYLRGEVAQVLFTQNADYEALLIATTALRQCPPDELAALPAYIGGLAAWRLRKVTEARRLFETAARAPVTSAKLRAAASFWAARTSRRMMDAVATVNWLRKAGEERRTFHGLLARRMLGLDTGIPPSGALMATADVNAVDATPAGRRAFALLQVGRPERAEAELRLLAARVQHDPTFARSLLAVASGTGLTALAAQLSDVLQPPDDDAGGRMRAFVPRLRPGSGFMVDPALVYALARQESNFDAQAVSSAGARGLMQIMPATAQYVLGDTPLSATQLHDPEFNLDLGQRYVTYLARQDGIASDLIRLLASYNAGPATVARWSTEMRDDGDPLLFIEAIPNAETRAFVPSVLTYSWIYAARLHLQAPSLDQLAEGEFPRFTPFSDRRKMLVTGPRR
ncbi:MAG TPA: lytic transglycosylase domain-containing protein [Acetobacteraceae bacterium]|nr:lytic transglycosylase domain-containing protein [Acetobacteraceae bacterium]